MKHCRLWCELYHACTYVCCDTLDDDPAIVWLVLVYGRVSRPRAFSGRILYMLCAPAVTKPSHPKKMVAGCMDRSELHGAGPGGSGRGGARRDEASQNLRLAGAFGVTEARTVAFGLVWFGPPRIPRQHLPVLL